MDPILIGFGAVVIASIGFALAQRPAATPRTIETTRMSTVAGAKPGKTVRIDGHARPLSGSELLSSPIGRRPCVGFVVRIVTRDTAEEEREVAALRVANPFRLEDDTGAIEVFPGETPLLQLDPELELAIGTLERLDERAREELARWLGSETLARLDNERSLILTEAVAAVDEKLAVAGKVAATRSLGSTDYRSARFAYALLAADDGPLMVSDGKRLAKLPARA